MNETLPPVSYRPALIITIGQRMRTARELNGISQIEAAKRLGYANSSKLAKIENSSDTSSVPLWLIPKASEVYQVSTDFLFGLSDEWECNGSAALKSHIAITIQQSQSVQDNPIKQLYNYVEAIESAVSTNLRLSAEFKELVIRFRYLNPNFDYLRLGSKLLRVANETSQEAGRISQQLAEYRNSIKSDINT